MASDDPQAVSERRVLRRAGVVPIEPDAAVAVMLEAGELVLATRSNAEVARHPADDTASPVAGELYLTDRRLIHLGEPPFEVPLDGIGEAEVTDDSLLLRIGPRGVSIRVSDPRALRTLIGVARSARRAGWQEALSGQSSSR